MLTISRASTDEADHCLLPTNRLPDAAEGVLMGLLRQPGKTGRGMSGKRLVEIERLSDWRSPLSGREWFEQQRVNNSAYKQS